MRLVIRKMGNDEYGSVFRAGNIIAKLDAKGLIAEVEIPDGSISWERPAQEHDRVKPDRKPKPLKFVKD